VYDAGGLWTDRRGSVKVYGSVGVRAVSAIATCRRSDIRDVPMQSRDCHDSVVATFNVKCDVTSLSAHFN